MWLVCKSLLGLELPQPARDEEAVAFNPAIRPLTVRRVLVSRLGVGCRGRSLCPGPWDSWDTPAPRPSLVSVSHSPGERPFKPVPLHPVQHKIGDTCNGLVGPHVRDRLGGPSLRMAWFPTFDIGRQWATLVDEDGHRRLDAPAQLSAGDPI